MFINIISILLVLLFAYGLIRNFRLGNYAYAFVMYVGMIIFYTNLYHNIGSGVSFYLMMLAIFAALSNAQVTNPAQYASDMAR